MQGFKKKRKFPIYSIFIAIFIGALASCILWYNVQLSPLDNNATELINVEVIKGSSPTQIADNLQAKSVIRSSTAFQLYARLSNNQDTLKAGVYSFSPAESTQEIIKHLVKGTVDTFNITFYPGATLVDNTDTDASKKQDITSVLKRAGYSDAEISAALSATYDSPLFTDKPAGADLEGYIFGETYNFNKGATVSDILKQAFSEFYSKVEQNGLIARFASHGLNLYQGITLASIIQREVSDPANQKQAAQVFYKRMEMGMALGSDVTYQYIADKSGVQRDVNLDSPYNTRRYVGLPPGPISTPGLSALLAVADPAEGDYLYFLSGDDEVMYFATTNEQHESNIANHCAVKCATP